MPPEFPEGDAREVSSPTRSPTATQPAEGLGGPLGWARAHRLIAGLVALGGVLLVGGAVAVWTLLAPSTGSHEANLRLAMEALDDGAYDEARRIVEAIGVGGVSPQESLGAPSFVLGAAAAYEAHDAWGSNREQLNLVAARYLEEARDLGFPPGREGEGLFLLGTSLYLTGQAAASRPVLEQALEANPRQRTEIHRLLAAAYLEDAVPKFLEALEHNAIHLADPTLSSEATHQGLLQRAEILLQLGKTSECQATLDKIPPEALNHVAAIVMRGRVLIDEARALKYGRKATEEDKLKAVEKYLAAIKTMRLALGRDTLAAQVGSKATYLIGVCFLELDDDRAALDQFRRTRDKYVATPEALAADFRIAELARPSGRDEEALAAYGRALEAVGDVARYSNPWLSLDELRSGMLSAYEHYRDTQDFPTCLELTRLFPSVFSRARTIELSAETYQLWGRSLLDRAADLRESDAEPLRREGRAQLRRAGRTFEQLARLRRMTGHYPDDLWDSAECYLEGQGYQNAEEVLQKYLKTQSRLRHPRALLNLGEALLAMGKIDEALAALEECIEFYPSDAASFHARLAASRAHREKGELEQARSLLEDNLNEVLTPDSNEWRDSLFGLGHLSYTAGRYEEATEHWEEAVARYPNSPQVVEARYLIADSYRRRAKQAQKDSENDLIETVRQEREQEISESLHAALDQYRQVQETLTQRERATELTRMEQSMLRNCYFSIGSVLFDLGQYDESIAAYRSAANRGQNVPCALEAYVQIARACRRLNKHEDVRKALAQAKVVLDRLKTAEDFQWTTIYSADQWPKVLDSL